MQGRGTIVRLKDIAAKAGVSVMTVSKVMRDAHDISPATKAKIRALANQMGYVPDTLAQGLRTRTTRLLGLVISSVANPVFARTIMAIEEGAAELGYDLIIAHHRQSPEKEEAIIRKLLARRVDGLLIAPVYRMAPKAAAYDEIRARGTPAVILGPTAPFCADFLNVEADNQRGAFAITQRLIALGHRRIAFLGGAGSSPDAQQRLEGYRRAHREAGLEVDDRLIFNSGPAIEDGERAALEMLNEGVKPTAIQAYTDLTAIGAANLLLNQGLKVPDDISVAGFGNTLVAEYFRVPLTTVRQPKFRLGAAAIEILKKQLRKEPAEPRRLEAEIVERASTAALKS